MKRTLVTGGTGFVGANLARRLLRDGHEVTLLVRKGFNAWRIDDIAADVRLCEVDITDRASVDQAFRLVQPEWVFHLAAFGAYPTQVDVPSILHTNVVGTANLAGAAADAGCEAFVNAGSSSEYGYKDHAPSEAEQAEPNSVYSVSKVSATMFCQHLARSTGMLAPTLRLYSAYGPFEEPTRLVPALVLRGLDNGFPPMADPNIARDYVYVDDVCDAFLLAATTAGQEPDAIYNIGTGTQTRLRDIADVIANVLDISEVPDWGSMEARAWDTNIWVADNRAAREVLGWKPRFELGEGLAATADWFRRNPELRDLYFERVPALASREATIK